MIRSILLWSLNTEGMRKFCEKHCTGFCKPAIDIKLEIQLKNDQDEGLFPNDIPATTPRLVAITGSARLFLDVCARRPELEAAIGEAEQHIPRPENCDITPEIRPDEQFFEELFVS